MPVLVMEREPEASRAAQPCQCRGGKGPGSLGKLGPEVLRADQINSVAMWFVSAVATN